MFAYCGVGVFAAEADDNKKHKILFFGDSWTALAQGAALDTLCEIDDASDLVIVNEGVSGSIAANWSLAQAPTDELETILKNNSDSSSVWINMGGNDILETGCQGDISSIINTYVKDVVNRTTSAIPEAKILLTTYGRTPLCPDEGFGALLESEACRNQIYGEHPTLLQALADQFDQVSFVNILYKFDASASIDDPSSSEFFADCIHLNDEGYNLFFADPDVQDVLCPINSTSASSVGMKGAPFLTLLSTILVWCFVVQC